MRAAFDKELIDLHARLVALGRTVQAQLDDALAALAGGDVAAETVVGRDRQVDRESARIETRLLCALARQAPVAGDLRLVAGLLHVNEHLERMGDLCANVARTVPGFADQPAPPEVQATLTEMRGRVREVVAAALTCFAGRDAAAAEQLPVLDGAVDHLNDQVFIQIKRSGGPGTLGWVSQAVLLARFLERLGDHAVDIGEQVRFMVTGEVRELLPSKAARMLAGAG